MVRRLVAAAAVDLDLKDTIVAISTPPGRGGLGVVRLSGTESQLIASALLLPVPNWQPWRVHAAELLDESGQTVDQVLISFFAKPHSYTAEDVVEISCHGSPVVLRHAVERAIALGARPAEPGEFTLRAFVNGRIDLPQAEAVHDLIEATTLYQAKVAARQLEGSVAALIRPWKERLVELIALLEAGIDFAEDDISVASSQEIESRLETISKGIAQLIDSFTFGRLVHDGLTLAIVGRTNVGKSSIFNCLLRQDRAIVTEIPGTTRDTVSESASIEGIPVKLIDTAGIRESTDLVERLGIERSRQAIVDSDITVVVLDQSSSLQADDETLLRQTRERGAYIVIGNKSDLPHQLTTSVDLIETSAVTGQGIDDLRAAILRAIAPDGMLPAQAGFITSARHVQLLKECREALARAREATAVGLPHEMLLLDCYAALRPLDAITGATTADDILNRIFSTFCIGK